LGTGASQTVVVAFNPTVANNYNQSVSFSGGSGTNVTVSGSTTNASSLVVVPPSPSVITKTITADIMNPITLQFTTNLTSPTWQTIGTFAGSTNVSFTNVPVVFIRGICSNLSGPVTLTWPPSTDPYLLGYNIYYGTATQTYTSMIRVGKVTTVTIPNLVGGKTYYFMVKSYDVLGSIIQVSNEMSAVPQTTGFSLTLSGI
jgi:Fibronectin type III domain